MSLSKLERYSVLFMTQARVEVQQNAKKNQGERGPPLQQLCHNHATKAAPRAPAKLVHTKNLNHCTRQATVDVVSCLHCILQQIRNQRPLARTTLSSKPHAESVLGRRVIQAAGIQHKLMLMQHAAQAREWQYPQSGPNKQSGLHKLRENCPCKKGLQQPIV